MRATDVLADALILFRRDQQLLLGLAGPFWFLPFYALALLVPNPPAPPAGLEGGSPEAAVWTEQFTAWVGAYGGWFVLAAAIVAWGSVTLYTLYLDRERPDMRAALARGARLWPRFMLMTALVGLMATLGFQLLILPGLYLLGRFAPAGPALVSERPLGAAKAIGRGWRLTRGAGLPLFGATAATLGLSWVATRPLLALDSWLRAQPDGANPVALATVDALAAAVATAGTLATGLIAVAAYRRLAR